MKLIEDHYVANRRNLVKRMSFSSGDYAEDIVQEAYARALKYYKSYNPDMPFDNWLKRIMVNVLKEHKNTEHGFSSIQYEEEEHDGTVCTGFNERVILEVNDLISTKSLIQIEVLRYHFQQGYTAKEVSEITEYGYKTSHQIIRRFRQELKELYGTG